MSIRSWLTDLCRSRGRRPISPIRRGGNLIVEALETRLAPAVLVNASTVKYQDIDGDNVTVKLSLPLLTDADTANRVLQFKTGSVDGDKTAKQQLTGVSLGALGPVADGVA